MYSLSIEDFFKNGDVPDHYHPGLPLEERHLESVTDKGLDAIVSDWLNMGIKICADCCGTGYSDFKNGGSPCSRCNGNGKDKRIKKFSRHSDSYIELVNVVKNIADHKFSFTGQKVFLDFDHPELAWDGRRFSASRHEANIKRMLVRAAAVLALNDIDPPEDLKGSIF